VTAASAGQVERHARDDDVGAEEQGAFEEERPLIVEQMVSPLRRHELRQHHGQKGVRSRGVDLFDEFEERLHK